MNIRIVESTGHGKTVAGAKKTSTIQVRDYCLAEPTSYLLQGQFRFKVGDQASKVNALTKARQLMNKLAAEKVTPQST